MKKHKKKNMSNEEKINSGKYVAVSKLERNAKNILLAIAILGGVAQSVRTWDLTFPTQRIKYDTIQHRKNTFHAKETTIIDIKHKVNDITKSQENLTNTINTFVIEQKKVNESIGLDLQQIKNRD